MAATKPLLLADLASGNSQIPSNYIRPENDRPKLDEVESFDGDDSIPLIDLQGLDGPDRFDVINQIGLACQFYGFFQVSPIKSIEWQ